MGVEGTWLAELGPMFFSIKESFESMFVKRVQRENQVTASSSSNANIQDDGSKVQDNSDNKSNYNNTNKSNSEKDCISNISTQRKELVATPGRLQTKSRKFMPKKRGRVGF